MSFTLNAKRKKAIEELESLILVDNYSFDEAIGMLSVDLSLFEYKYLETVYN